MGKFQQINVRLTADRYQELRRVCEVRGASVTKVVCLLVEKYIDDPEGVLGVVIIEGTAPSGSFRVESRRKAAR